MVKCVKICFLAEELESIVIFITTSFRILSKLSPGNHKLLPSIHRTSLVFEDFITRRQRLHG